MMMFGGHPFVPLAAPAETPTADAAQPAATASLPTTAAMASSPAEAMTKMIQNAVRGQIQLPASVLAAEAAAATPAPAPAPSGEGDAPPSGGTGSSPSSGWASAADLLRRILVPSPHQRYHISDIMSHPWFQVSKGRGRISTVGLHF